MKELAEFIRILTPFLTDIQRYKYISGFHLYFQIFLVIFCYQVYTNKNSGFNYYRWFNLVRIMLERLSRNYSRKRISF